jgi:hypothetical protein
MISDRVPKGIHSIWVDNVLRQFKYKLDIKCVGLRLKNADMRLQLLAS